MNDERLSDDKLAALRKAVEQDASRKAGVIAREMQTRR